MASMNAVQLSSTSTTGGNVRWQYICRADVTCVTIAEWSVSVVQHPTDTSRPAQYTHVVSSSPS